MFTIGLAGMALSDRTAHAQDITNIMPLGDSITADNAYGGYRHLLYGLLAQDGISFRFVGSLISGDVPDGHHEGHSGWTIDQISKEIAGWLETYNPDLVLLHIGTNDIWHRNAIAPAHLAALIDSILAHSSHARIIVAQILPMTNDAKFEAVVRKYNAAIAAIVSSKTSRVSLVNMHDSFSAVDFVDGVHPTGPGYDKMARIWEPAIRAAISP
jgi:lysophospholipase L1-like esterase